MPFDSLVNTGDWSDEEVSFLETPLYICDVCHRECKIMIEMMSIIISNRKTEF